MTSGKAKSMDRRAAWPLAWSRDTNGGAMMKHQAAPASADTRTASRQTWDGRLAQGSSNNATMAPEGVTRRALACAAIENGASGAESQHGRERHRDEVEQRAHSSGGSARGRHALPPARQLRVRAPGPVVVNQMARPRGRAGRPDT